MKTVILALLVLVVVSQGEALKCVCQGWSCRQTCRGSNQVCANIVTQADFKIESIRRCMDAAECNWRSVGALHSECCDHEDFCA